MTPEALADVSVIIQAGGEGTRLQPATNATPKAMLRVGGMPIIERLLRHLVTHGLRSFTVVTRHLGTVIESYVGSLHIEGARIAFLREHQPLGNAGALRLVRETTSPTLLAFADLVTDLDPSELLRFHTRCGGDLTLASHWDTHRLQFGELAVEGDCVVGYEEKPLKRFRICSGVAVIAPRLLEFVRDGTGPLGIVDVANKALASGFDVRHWEHQSRWFDINSEEQLHAADLEFAPVKGRG
ncbi:MAG: NDP-sugar synthase [Actinomycetota bacterium]